MRFRGKTAIVTGGSQGIGHAVATALVAEGANVVLVGRRADPLAEAVAQLGHKACAVPGDVADPATAERAVSRALETYGSVDLLVLNAAESAIGDVLTQPLDQVERMLAVNLLGSVAFVRTAAAAMAHRSDAAITLVSAASARTHAAGLGVFSATKAALNHLAVTWSVELAGAGIRVNAISPGTTATQKLHTVAGAVPGLIDAMIDKNLVRRLATPEEIAALTLTMLDSKQSGFVTGAVWDIDGGFDRGPASDRPAV